MRRRVRLGAEARQQRRRERGRRSVEGELESLIAVGAAARATRREALVVDELGAAAVRVEAARGGGGANPQASLISPPLPHRTHQTDPTLGTVLDRYSEAGLPKDQACGGQARGGQVAPSSLTHRLSFLLQRVVPHLLLRDGGPRGCAGGHEGGRQVVTQSIGREGGRDRDLQGEETRGGRWEGRRRLSMGGKTTEVDDWGG